MQNAQTSESTRAYAKESEFREAREESRQEDGLRLQAVNGVVSADSLVLQYKCSTGGPHG